MPKPVPKSPEPLITTIRSIFYWLFNYHETPVNHAFGIDVSKIEIANINQKIFRCPDNTRNCSQ